MSALAQSDSYLYTGSYRGRAALFTQDCVDLASIYKDHFSLCIWTPPVCQERARYAHNLATAGFQFRRVIPIDDILANLGALPDGSGQFSMKSWIVELVEVYATLFGLEQVGVRIAGLKSPMCPRFHVDHVQTRLIHSLSGEGCDWFADSAYFDSGEYSNKELSYWLQEAESADASNIHQAPAGSVVLMKGTRWSEEGIPVIHRSPRHDHPRLVLTLDFA